MNKNHLKFGKFNHQNQLNYVRFVHSINNSYEYLYSLVSWLTKARAYVSVYRLQRQSWIVSECIHPYERSQSSASLSNRAGPASAPQLPMARDERDPLLKRTSR